MKEDSLDNSQQIELLSSMASAKKIKIPVYANMYNFSKCFNYLCNCCGLGLYHTGI